VIGQGHHIFVEALAQVAAEAGEPRLRQLVAGLREPPRVGVRGRAGVGCRTVVRALHTAGVRLAQPGETPDVDVYVLAETLKPEDRAALAGSGRPCVVVFNKADLTGFGGGGPTALAAARCRRLRDLTGQRTQPLVALLAVAGLDGAVVDDMMVDALRILATEPADLGSTDRFVDGPHQLSRQVRERLLAELDLFGIARAVVAVRHGAGKAAVGAALREASGIDAVVAAVESAAAPVRYLRIVNSVSLLAELTAGADGAPLAERLAGDDVVLARMAAAAGVVQDAGMTVDPADDRAAHLRRAIDWQRYSGGPVTPLHRACGADIARGSLRLWERAGGVPEAPR